MAGIDYSKWDKMAREMDDSSDDDEPMNDFTNDAIEPPTVSYSNQPHVTTLKQPSSVTIGPSGVVINGETEDMTANPNGANSHLNPIVPKSESNRNNAKSYPKSIDSGMESKLNDSQLESKSKPVAKKSEISLESLIQKWTFNGGETELFYWTQSATEVIIRFKIDLNTRAKQIRIDWHLKTLRLQIYINNKPLFTNIDYKTLSKKIKPSKEEMCGLEWELKKYKYTHSNINANVESNADSKSNSGSNVDSNGSKNECKLLEITMEKLPFSLQIIEWWDSVFIGDPKIDTTRIVGRKTDASEMKQIWDKAHQQFKQNIAEFQPQEIEIPDDELPSHDSTDEKNDA